MNSRFSSFSSTSTYSHLLYLNDQDRAHYLSGSASFKARPESVSFFSMTSTRPSSESARSDFSHVSTPSTRNSSMEAATMPTQKYADDHYPLITTINPSGTLDMSTVPPKHFAVDCARRMAAIHNSMIRAFNASYNHAISVKPATQRCTDFLHFNQILYNMLEHHHHVEEDYFFGALEDLMGQPGLMHENVVGHEAFMPALHKFGEFIADPGTAAKFDGVQFRKLIDSFAPLLIQHLHDEIPTLVNLHTADDAKLRKIWAQAEKMAIASNSIWVDAPFVVGCQDKTFLVDGQDTLSFPGIPKIVEVLIRKVFARRHANVWEFLPSDLSGSRRMIVA